MGNCGDCRFYTPFPDKKGWGYCHRYPPSGWKATSIILSGEFAGQVVPKSGRVEGLSARYDGRIKGLWEQPQMEPRDWCGEYQPKDEELEPEHTPEPATSEPATSEPATTEAPTPEPAEGA